MAGMGMAQSKFAGLLRPLVGGVEMATKIKLSPYSPNNGSLRARGI